MKKKVVIFDFDGTIGDTFDLSLNTINDFFKKWRLKGLDISEVRVYQKKFSKRGRFRKYNFPFWVLLHLSVGVFQRKLLKKADQIESFEGMVDILEYLDKKDVRIGIVTNNLKKTVMKFLINNNLEGYFEFVYSSKLAFAKTYAFKKIIKNYNIDKDSMLYIGDEVRDIQSCKLFGIPVISVSWGYDIRESLEIEKPDWLVHDTKDLLKLLKTLV